MNASPAPACFRPGFEPLPQGTDIFQHPDVPDVLVRGGERPFGWDSTFEYIIEVREKFRELGDFDIAVVPNRWVVDGNGAAVVVVDRLEGSVFDTSEAEVQLGEEERAAAINLQHKLFDYLWAKLESGEDYLSDVFGLHQYLYDYSQKEMVLVDIDPLILPQKNPGTFDGDVMTDMLCRILQNVHDIKPTEAELEEWWGKTYQCLGLIFEKNDLEGDDEGIKAVISDILEQGNSEYHDTFIGDITL